MRAEWEREASEMKTEGREKGKRRRVNMGPWR